MNVTMPSVPLLTGTAALALQAATADLRGYPPSHPDSQLLALAEKFFVESALFCAAEDETPEEEVAFQAYQSAIDQMTGTPAIGPVGLMAKARVIMSYRSNLELMADLTASLCADCIRLAGGAA